MAETKPKGEPVFLKIPTTGETITLPGVTSLSNNDELKAAADAWIAKNYKGPTLAAPVVARLPVAGETQDAAPREQTTVLAPWAMVKTPELKAYVPDTLIGAVYDDISSGVANVAGLLPGFDERDAALYGDKVVSNIEGLLGLESLSRSFQNVVTGRGTGGDVATVGLNIAPFAARPLAAGFGRVAPEISAILSRFATGSGAAPMSALSPEMAAIAYPITPTALAKRGPLKPVKLPEVPVAAAAIPEAVPAVEIPEALPAASTRPVPSGKFTIDGVDEVVPRSNTRSIPSGKFTIDGVDEALPAAALSPEMAAIAKPVTTAPVVPRTRMPEEQGVAGIKALDEKGQTRPIATQEVTDKVLRFEVDYLKETGLSRPERLPLKDFFFMHFDAGTLPMDRTLELAKQAGIDPSDLTDFVAGSQQTATEAARILRARMVMSKYIKKEAADVAEAGVKTPDELGLWKRTTDVTRGLMVSQLATTMRNTIGSAVRLPIDMATSLTSTAINAAINPFRNDKVGANALDAFAVLTDRFQPARNKQFYEQLRTYYPKTVKDLNATFAADVAGGVAKDKFGKVEKVVNTLNLVNRVSETTTRNVMFPVYLRRELTRRNMNIDDIVDAQRLDEIPQDAIEAALRETMDFTYGAAPKTDHIMGKVADKFIGLVEALGPAGVTIAPFPRFMVSAIRFQAEYNPLGVARLLSKKNRDALMSGDTEVLTEVLSKAIVGSGLFGAAYLFRDSDAAGEKWSEAKLPDGRVIDMKAYFPVPQYLLVADIVKRYNDGQLNGQTLDQAIDAKEIFQAVTGSQFRAGTGLYVVDEFIKDLTDAGSDPKKYLDIIGKFAADYGAALFTPMQTLKDFYAEYNPEEAIYRDTKGDMLGTLTRSIPGAQRALGIPEAESPTREGPMTTENPALRQLLGVTVRPAKNIVESELDKLGIAAYKVGSKTGDADTDRLINRDLGIIAERGIAPLLQSPEYQSLDNVGKSAAIKKIYAKAREVANAKFNAENPELGLLKKVKGMNREEEIMLNRQVKTSTGMSAPELLRQLSKAPLMKSQEQFDALPVGAQYTDPGDYQVYTKGK